MDSTPSNGISAGGQSSISIRVVEAVAEREGIDPLEVSPPLHDAIDPNALDALFEPTASGRRADGTVSFTYHGYRVRVESDGRIALGDETERASKTQSDSEVR